ncbi:MBL fold metallo-hydrolase [Candidatus Bipolaricaulota bacterium]|nr:MBL fold metallo-hydrolase [Candidatus Bipolaricaulota bacterium]
MELTGVYDNTVEGEGIISGWGFSLLVSTGNENILFDVGADLMVLEQNLSTLDISPSELDGVFLSHPHCDHVGGLSGILTKNSDLTVFLTRSFPSSLKNRVENYGADLVILSEPREIFEGIWSTGEITGSHRGQDLPEQGLVMTSPQGPVIISGCAHPGITKLVRRSKKIVGKPPYLTLGGFHLVAKNEQEVQQVINELRSESVKKLAPTHCTGEKAINLISKGYGKDFVEFGAGTEIVI